MVRSGFIGALLVALLVAAASPTISSPGMFYAHSNAFATVLTGVIRPLTDSTTAIQLQNAAGTAVVNVDTTNSRMGIGNTSPSYAVDTTGYVRAVSGLLVGSGDPSGGLIDASGASKSVKVVADTGSLGANSYISFEVDYLNEIMRLASTGNIGLNTTTFGTTLTKGISIGEGTAATAAATNATMLWTADQNGATTNALYMMNEKGQSGVVAHQAPLQNLLTNSGFKVWSNSTLENVGSNLVTNGGFDSDTTGWTPTDCTIASVAGGESGNALEITRTGGSSQNVASTAITGLTVGKLYKISVYVKSGTSTDEAFRVHDGTINHIISTTTSSWVNHTKVFEASATSITLYLQKYSATAGTMLFDTVTLYEVTPGCVAADALGPDGWYKYDTATDLYRESTIVKAGSQYSIRLVGNSVGALVSWPTQAVQTAQTIVKRVAGRQVTFGAWLYAATSGTSGFLYIYDGSSVTPSSTYIGNSTWTWVEMTQTLGTGISNFTVAIKANEIGAQLYVSQPMLVFGPSIGQGNYSEPPGEVVHLEAPVTLSTFNATAKSDVGTSTVINMEVESSGKLPKGAREFMGQVALNDSASAANDAYMIVESGTNKAQRRCQLGYLAPNDRLVYCDFEVPADDNGDLYHRIEATGASTLDATIQVNAVRIN